MDVTLRSTVFVISECSHCKTLLRNASVCYNGCGWLHVRCSVLKRSADRPPGFECPQCISKAAHGDRNVPTTALSTDLHAESQDHRTSLPPRDAQAIADDVSDGPIVATPPPPPAPNVAEKNENI